MLNIEKYKEMLIAKGIINTEKLALVQGQPHICDDNIRCRECLFNQFGSLCSVSALKWLFAEYKEEEELYKAHEEGYEDCKKDFNLEGNAGNGWIPCKERLPETFESEAKAYLTIDEEGMIGVSYYHCGWSNGYESVFDIIAWQSLPEPYREEQEDE